MNRFGRMALELWQELAPESLKDLPDREEFFSALGEEAEEAWIQRSLQLAGPDVPGEPWLEKVGRMENARLRAEEMIRHELLTPPTPEQVEEEDDPDWVDPVFTFWQEIEKARQEAFEEEDQIRRASTTDEFF